MTISEVAELVERAQRGEIAAFEALVGRYQAMAQGYALARLGDREAARDASQDAFVDAFLHLGELREPRAFAGWLRRIVFKHCDRQRRRRREERSSSSLDDASSKAGAGRLRSSDIAAGDAARSAGWPSPVEELARSEARSWLRAAIESLPEHERLVVALHYFGDAPLAEIAAFLEISVAAAKKRLFSARRRLKEGGPMNAPATDVSDFSDPIALFLAIRADDLDAVERVLGRRPDLLEAEERWSDDEALAGGFTLAHRIKPIVLAASLGRTAIVERLLALGASAEGPCGCDNGETALWAAARAGHREVVRRLLAAGASPDAVNGRGVSAAELAAWRGDGELLHLLFEHGASPGRACAWAAELGHAEVAAAFGLSAAPRAGMRGLGTGIKALDLFVPFEPGDVVRVHGAAETGLMVLLCEIAHALSRRGAACVWATWRRFPWHAHEMASVAARHGLEDVDILHDRPGEPLLSRALSHVASLRAHRDLTALFVFEEEGHAAEVEAAAMDLAGGATITFLVRPWAAVTRGAPRPALEPYQGVIETSPELAARGLYPAIDPRSRSIHATARAETARQLLLASPRGDLRPEDLARGERLEAFLTQPFHAATPETGWLGADVPRAETFRTVDAILDGSLALPPEALRYRGIIPV